MRVDALMDDRTISIGLPSDEARLVAELQSGSEQAFAQLIDQFHQPIYSLISHSLKDPTDAADITQEVFLKVFRSIRGFHGEASLRTWLYRIALREASNQRRWWSRHKHHEIGLDTPCCSYSSEGKSEIPTILSTLTAGGASPFDQAAQLEIRRRVEAALHQLPKCFRAVVVLREIEGLTYDEIADLLQVNLGTVKSRLMRGRAALRVLLAPSSEVLAVPVTSRRRAELSSLPGPSLHSGLEVSR